MLRYLRLITSPVAQSKQTSAGFASARGQVEDVARIRDRGHLVRRVVAVLPDAEIRVGDLAQPAAAIIDILHGSADVVLGLRHAIARIVGEGDVAAVGRYGARQVAEGVAHQRQLIPVAMWPSSLLPSSQAGRSEGDRPRSL